MSFLEVVDHTVNCVQLMQIASPEDLQVDQYSHDGSMHTTDLVAREVTKPYCCVALFRTSKIEVCLAAADLKQGELLLMGCSCASFDFFKIPPDFSSMLRLTTQI